MVPSKPFKWRHFQSDLILLNVRWYLRYSLSYRDLAEMMLERGIKVDHTTIYRWVQAYSPEIWTSAVAGISNLLTTRGAWMKHTQLQQCSENFARLQCNYFPQADPVSSGAAGFEPCEHPSGALP